MTYPVYGGPLGSSECTDLQQNFHWMYATCNSPRDTSSFCSWTAFKSQLNITPGWATANGDGVLMFYMIENDVTGDYFSYAFVEAQRDILGNFEPKPGATYFSLLPTGGIKQYITPAEILYMNQCILNYETVVQTANFNDLITSTSVLISTLANHPKKAFLSAETVWKFFDDNSALVNGTTDIVLTNGAVYTDIVPGPLSAQYKGQTPILAYQIGVTALLSDDTPDWTMPFQNKAMDRGMKCPPQCS